MKTKTPKPLQKFILVVSALALLLCLCLVPASACVIATHPTDGRVFHFVDYVVEYTTYDSRYDEYSTKYAHAPALLTQPIASVKYDGFTKSIHYPTTDVVAVTLFPAPSSASPILYNRLRISTDTAYVHTSTTFPADGVAFREILASANLGDYDPNNEYSWEARCHVRIEYQDGTVYSQGMYTDSTSTTHYYSPADFVYDLAMTTSRPLDTIKYVSWSNFEVLVSPNTNVLDYCPIIYVGTPTATYSPLDVIDIPQSSVIVEEIVFDGDVGIADLVLKPLQALVDFELFPNFSLGSVFGIIAGIALFVIILKVFAGG